MSAKAKTKQHMILVAIDKLTSKNISPTSQELFELMHLTSCDHAIKRWKDEWLLCPVCFQPVIYSYDTQYGTWARTEHKHRDDLIC